MVERAPDLLAQASSPLQTAAIAHTIAEVLVPGDVLVLGGDLGAGKTTFTKALGAAIGITEHITSPTFTLAQQYSGGRLVLHHLDVYRIDQIDEVIDLALPELYESGGVVVIEWGDTIAPALPAGYLLVKFEFGDADDDRSLALHSVGVGWSARVPQLKAALSERMPEPQDAP